MGAVQVQQVQQVQVFDIKVRYWSWELVLVPRDGLRQGRRRAALRQQLDAISVRRLDRERKNTKKC